MEKKIIKGSELADKTLEVQEDGSLRIIETGRFIPKSGENYYFVNSFGIIINTNNTTPQDGWCVSHNPVFCTKEECEEYKRYLEFLDEYTFEPNWKDRYEEKYRISFETDYDDYEVECLYTDAYEGSWFKSREMAREFIDKVGIKNIKRFMFNIWE